MAHNDRKTRKLRGSRTCGYGNAQKHRGAGSRGGRGMAGGKTHKWMHISKNYPGYFGKKGFNRPKAVIRVVNTVNIGYIDENLDRLIRDGKIQTKGTKYLIDLREMNYDKLLGSGRVTHPLVITIGEYSSLAIKKVEDAGGEIIKPEEDIAKPEEEIIKPEK